MSAPVCNIIPPNTPGDPAGKLAPTIPVANDLASALAAIRAITAWINSQQQPQRSGGGSGGGGTQLKTTPKQPKPQKGRWNETHRTTQTVKVTNPQDPTQFVEVQQISSLTMTDSQTGETWIWHF